MTTKRHFSTGNIAAIAVATLALIATAGTAVAATAGQVTITDPHSLNRGVRVDTAGRLATAGPTATINSVQVTGGVAGIDVVLVDATTASLAIERVGYTTAATNSRRYFVRLEQVKVDPATHDCLPTLEQRPALGVASIGVGANVENQFDAPITVAPIASAPYCVVARFVPDQAQGPWDDIAAQLTGYVLTGTYTGLGTPSASQVRSADVHPGTRK